MMRALLAVDYALVPSFLKSNERNGHLIFRCGCAIPELLPWDERITAEKL
jgi:hypothetical protein